MKSSLKKNIFRCIIAFLSFSVVVVCGELFCRLAGYPAWRDIVQKNEPLMYQPDDSLGWKPLPGKYVIKAYAEGEPDIRITFTNDILRKTSPNPVNSDIRIPVIGGSYTEGWAISDEETYTWNLQKRYPGFKFMNMGCGGYGTLQSLIRLEDYFASPKAKGAKHPVVIYGFIGHHVVRNAGTASWMRILSEFSNRGQVKVPYCTYDKKTKTTTRHAPDAYPVWPLVKKSVLMNRLLTLYMKKVTKGRKKYSNDVTAQCFLDLKRLCKKNGATLVVLMLWAHPETKEYWTNYFTMADISMVDCCREIDFGNSPQYQVPGEGHPNGKLNAIWADRIDASLKKIIPPHLLEKGLKPGEIRVFAKPCKTNRYFE